jgi:hypothetical protein
MRRVIGLLLSIGAVFLAPFAGTVHARHSRQASACTRFVNSTVATSGDGSASRPWKTIPIDLNLAPGQVVCVRGDTSGPGRVYETTRIELHSAGTAAAPITLRPYPGERVILRSLDQGGVIKYYGQYWIVEGFIIDNNGSSWRAVIFDTISSNNILRNNEVFDGTNMGLDVNLGSRNNRIEGNHVHHFIRTDGNDANCIQLGAGADNTVIVGNTFHDCSGDGIQMTLPPNDPNSIADAADNVQIIGNVFYRGNPPAAENALDVKAASNLQVIGNQMYGYVEDAAVKHWRNSRNSLYAGNRIHDSVRAFNFFAREGGWPEGLTLHNNLLYNFSEYAIQIVGARDVTLVHNTIANAGDWSLNIAHGGIVGGLIRNNLFVNSGIARAGSGAVIQNVTISHNGWFNTPTQFGSPSDVVSQGSPGFADAANHDYHLQANSPARDVGFDLGLAVDFEGDPRPAGGGPDLGADEYAAAIALRAVPQDGALHLIWNEVVHPDLASFALVYSRPSGASDANQGASPIANLPSNTRSFVLTGLSNYRTYTLSLVARDQSQADLFASNTIRAIPSDRFVFLPQALRSAFGSAFGLAPELPASVP